MKKLAVIGTIFVLMSCSTPPPSSTDSKASSSEEKVSFKAANDIVQQRCVSCHSASPTDSSVSSPAGNLSLDSAESMKQFATRIKARAVTQKDMPQANKTNMTDDERALLGGWVDQGAQTE